MQNYCYFEGLKKKKKNLQLKILNLFIFVQGTLLTFIFHCCQCLGRTQVIEINRMHLKSHEPR